MLRNILIEIHLISYLYYTQLYAFVNPCKQKFYFNILKNYKYYN